MTDTTFTAREQLFHLLRKSPTASFNQVGTKDPGLNKGDYKSMPQNFSIKQSESEEKRSVIQKEKRCLSTCETKKKLRSRTQAHHRQTQSCSKSEEQSLSDEMQSENENLESSNLPKNHTNSHLTPAFLVGKSQPKHLQIYTCFLCFLSNSQDCMWENSQQYLAHMSSLHKDFLDFEDILKNKEDNFNGSHIFYKGKLTAILSNTRYQGEFELYFQLKNQMFNQLYFCSCPLKTFKNYFKMKHYSPIFNSERNFIAHLQKCSHKNKITSHQLKQSRSKVFLKKNPNFDIDLQMDKIKGSFNLMKIVIKSRINMLSMRRFLKKIPMNVLQIVSCNLGLVPPKNISVPFPECHICCQLFSHTRQLLSHRGQQCTQLRYKNKYQYSKEDLRKLSQLRKLESCKKTFLHHIFKLKNLFKLTQDESDILEAHLSIVEQNAAGTSWRALICGHCKAVFTHGKKPYFDYLLHIYRQHQTLHPLNSHYIRFVQKLPKEKEQSDQEEEEN